MLRTDWGAGDAGIKRCRDDEGRAQALHHCCADYPVRTIIANDENDRWKAELLREPVSEDRLIRDARDDSSNGMTGCGLQARGKHVGRAQHERSERQNGSRGTASFLVESTNVGWSSLM